MKILVVDDSPSILELVASVLRQAGHSVEEAPNADVAESFLSEHGPYGLIITDWKMPDEGDGERVIRHSGDTPVLVMSGSLEFVPEGAEDLITKPFELSDLVARVAQFVRKSPPE